MRRALAIVLVALATLVTWTASAQTTPATVGPASSVVPTGLAGSRLTSRGKRLGAWLPQGEDLFEPWRRRLAAPSPALAFGELADVPLTAKGFVHGPGLVKVQALYDPAHRLVLYHQSCCAWNEVVLARAPAPPELVGARDLSAVRTRHGIALGASPASVVRAYGPARSHRSTRFPNLRVLSYWRDGHVRGSACAWFENFVFRANRLIEIQAGHGC